MNDKNKKLYPLEFEDIYKMKIWGTDNLKYFNEEIENLNIIKNQYKKVGEIYLLCDDKEKSIIKNGFLKGISIEEAIKKYKNKIIGKFYEERFVKDNHFKLPILIKHIIATQDLSYQVHLIKKEVMYALEDSKIKHNTNLKKEEILKESKLLEKNTKELEIKKGNFAYINANTLHSLRKDANVLEISNNSNDTYRLYDYNRNRKLNLIEGLKYFKVNNKVKLYKNSFENENFKISKKNVNLRRKIKNTNYFKILIPLEGELKLSFNQSKNINEKDNEMQLKKNKVILIPNEINQVYVIGNGKFLEIEMISKNYN